MSNLGVFILSDSWKIIYDCSGLGGVFSRLNGELLKFIRVLIKYLIGNLPQCKLCY